MVVVVVVRDLPSVWSQKSNVVGFSFWRQTVCGWHGDSSHLLNTVPDRKAEVGLAALPGGAATDDLGTILERLFTVERTLCTREPEGGRGRVRCGNAIAIGKG